MLDLVLSAVGVVLHAIAEAISNLFPGSPERRRRRETRRRVRRMGRTSDWDGIRREFDEAMAAGTSSRLPSTVVDAIPKRGASHVSDVITRALTVADPLTLMPAARLAPHTEDPEVLDQLVRLRNSGDPRLEAVADYAIGRWPGKSQVTTGMR